MNGIEDAGLLKREVIIELKIKIEVFMQAASLVSVPQSNRSWEQSLM